MNMLGASSTLINRNPFDWENLARNNFDMPIFDMIGRLDDYRFNSSDDDQEKHTPVEKRNFIPESKDKGGIMASKMSIKEHNTHKQKRKEERKRRKKNR